MRKIFFPLLGCMVVMTAGFGLGDRPLQINSALAQDGSIAPATSSGDTVRPWSAEPVPEWDALFDRTSDWTGADGAYSLSLPAVPAAGISNPRILWTFNDTLVGRIDERDHRIGSREVRNSMALQNGTVPDPNQIQFFYGESQSGPRALVRPDESAQQWYWPNAGLVLNDKIYLFSLRMKPNDYETGDGIYDFAYDGISLLSDRLDNPQPFQANYSQIETPLYAASTCDRGAILFGQSVLNNTATAATPSPDGYIYIYGVRNDLDSKKLIVARVLPEFIEDFTQYRYWDGQQWSEFIANAAPITDQMSSEFSVTPLPDGRYIMVFQLNDFLSETVAVRYSNSLVGPWTAPIPIWDTHTDRLDLQLIAYGAKAHPDLSQPGELLISYHSNTLKFSQNYDHADIYRPRFLRLSLSDTAPLAGSVPPSANLTRRTEADRLYAQAAEQFKLNQAPTALNSAQQALKIYEEIGDRPRAGVTLNLIGEIYLQQGQYAPALETTQKALAINEEVNNRVQQGVGLTNIGQAYAGLGQYAEALEFYQRALPVRREVSDRCGEGITQAGVGRAHFSMGQYDLALEALQQALPIHREVSDRPREATTLKAIGDTYAQLGNWSEARRSYREAIALYQAMGDRAGEETIRQSLEALSQR
jgi:tetratricopeptide (TPR) repeat protein